MLRTDAPASREGPLRGPALRASVSRPPVALAGRPRDAVPWAMDSDSTDATPWGRWLLLPALALPLIAWTTTLPGCAEPCLDDGLGQKFCPGVDTEAATGDTVASGDGDGDSMTTNETNDNGDTEGCPLLDVILVPQTPTMVLLVDQSL